MRVRVRVCGGVGVGGGLSVLAFVFVFGFLSCSACTEGAGSARMQALAPGRVGSCSRLALSSGARNQLRAPLPPRAATPPPPNHNNPTRHSPPGRAKGAPSIVLPHQEASYVRHIALDIGGSLIKV
jgi:hypothetical protein